METGKIGIAKVAIRNRGHLWAIKADDLFLMLELMHFAQEVLEPEGLRNVSGAELSAKEIEMAKSLVESLSGEWDPTKYVDRYEEALREVIEAKIQNRPQGEAPKAPKSAGPVIDLLAVLRESIRETADKRKSRPPVASSAPPISSQKSHPSAFLACDVPGVLPGLRTGYFREESGYY